MTLIDVVVTAVASVAVIATLLGIWALCRVYCDLPLDAEHTPRFIRASPPAVLFRPDLLSSEGRRAYRLLIECVATLLLLVLSLAWAASRVKGPV